MRGKESFMRAKKMQDHGLKSHKLTAKLSCEYFFIAAESQDYPLSYSRTVPVPDLENKKTAIIIHKRLQYPQIVKFAFSLIKGFST